MTAVNRSVDISEETKRTIALDRGTAVQTQGATAGRRGRIRPGHAHPFLRERQHDKRLLNGHEMLLLVSLPLSGVVEVSGSVGVGVTSRPRPPRLT